MISLAPDATELAYAAGMEGQLVGVSSYSDYPPQASRIEQVANWQGINIERILALKPDIILAWRGGNPQRSLDQLARFGIQIIYLDAVEPDDIAKSLQTLANYSGKPDIALNAAAQFRQQLAQLTLKYQHNPPQRVFMAFGLNPLFTASGATLQSKIVSLCGGSNIFADSSTPWPKVSREQVLLRKPQLILLPGGKKERAEAKVFWGQQLSVPVLAVDQDWLNRASPRILLAAEAICQQISLLKER